MGDVASVGRTDEGAGWLDVGVAAALVRRYAEDQGAFLEQFSVMLETALPERVEVKRSLGVFSAKQVQRLELRLDDRHYRLERGRSGGLQASLVHVVRGIAIKTEPLSVERWLDALGTALDEQSRQDERTQSALARWLG
jgi:hypothetical protein